MSLRMFSRPFIILAVIMLCSLRPESVSAQIITYTNDTGGVLNMVAANAVGDTLTRVNGASRLSTPCTHGFSTKSFTNATVFADTLPAVEIVVAPKTGYLLKADTFKVDLRHSPTGPANARFAYSTDSATWIDQGTDQLPYGSGACDSVVTCAWPKAVTVIYPKKLFFRVYGFNCSVSTGTGNLQILNLSITGKVMTPAATSVAEVNEDELLFNAYPNPTSGNIELSYVLNSSARVNLEIHNLLGQVVERSVVNEQQASGVHKFNLTLPSSGIYFARLTVGDNVITKKISRL